MNSDVSGRSRTARQSGATKTLEQLIKKRGVIVGQMAGRGAVSTVLSSWHVSVPARPSKLVFVQSAE